MIVKIVIFINIIKLNNYSSVQAGVAGTAGARTVAVHEAGTAA